MKARLENVKNIIVKVDGLRASGKSSFLHWLREQLEDQFEVSLDEYRTDGSETAIIKRKSTASQQS